MIKPTRVLKKQAKQTKKAKAKKSAKAEQQATQQQAMQQQMAQQQQAQGAPEQGMAPGYNSGKVIHGDFGDNIGAFTKNGAHISNGYLEAGVPKDNTQLAYSWWNTDKPYSLGSNNKFFTRFMSVNENDVPGILKVREQKYPIGQWNGKSGFVASSERVTSNPVPLDNINMLQKDPLTNTWGRVKYVVNKNNNSNNNQTIALNFKNFQKE